MNTSERPDERRADRKEQKLKKRFVKLNPTLQQMVMQISYDMAQESIQEYEDNLNRNISAAVILSGGNIKEANVFNSLVGELMNEDANKVAELEKGYKSKEMCKMGAKRIEAEVRKEVEKLIQGGTEKNEAIEELKFKFPKLSRSMIVNAYQTVKEEIEIENYIFGEDKKVKNRKEDFQEKTEKEFKNGDVVVTENTIEQENLGQPVVVENATTEVKRLKVLSMTLKGQNGTYRACENGVEISEMDSIISFESIGQVDEWANEVKQVFEMLNKN